MEANLSPELVDERQGLPSASGLERIALCPGSWNLEQALRVSGGGATEPADPDAASGTRIHDALAGSPSAFDKLNEDEIVMFSKCQEQLIRLAEKVLPRNERVTVYSEIREWLYGTSGKPIMSGKVDVLTLTKSRGLVVDFKTGRNEVTESPENLQLLSLAVIMSENFGPRPFDVAIIQPWVNREPDVFSYSIDDLAYGSKRIEKILEKAADPEAPRIPGKKQCDFCRAKHLCPEARGVITDLIPMKPERMTPAVAAQVLDHVQLAKKVIDAVEKRAKELLKKDPNAIPGWQLEEGAMRRTVTDPQQAFLLLSDAKLIDQDAFVGCCKVQLGELEKSVAQFGKLEKKEAHETVNRLLKKVIATKKDQPSLAKVKP